METLAQSEGRLRERVFTLEGEKEQLARTVARLQDLLSSLQQPACSSPDGLALPTVVPSAAPSLGESQSAHSVPSPAAHPQGS